MTHSPADLKDLREEGRILLRYLLGRMPADEMVELYASGVASAARPAEMDLRPIERRLPASLWFRDVASVGRQTEFRARMHVAALVAECFPEGTRDLYDYRGDGRLAAVLGLCAVVLVEALPFALRKVCVLLTGGTRS
jgi:hypothetical protein